MVVLQVGCQLVVAGQKVQVNQPCGSGDHPSVAEVEHSVYDRLLRKYVDDRGMVAYARWKASSSDIAELGGYLAKLGCVDLGKSAPKAARLAYWINLYNALTLHGILREYPTSSIRKHTSTFGYNIWKDLLVTVDGRAYSLEDIEHKVLRKLGEPRIHLAIVCASRGCPPLLNEAYSAAKLDEQLNGRGREFFSRPENFRVDASKRTVYFSQLFEWYGSDFAPTSSEQLKAFRAFLPDPGVLDWATSEGVRYRYLSYDWSLNDQQPIGK
jgi:hypothetical protein